MEEYRKETHRYEYLDRNDTQCQPCDNFTYEDEGHWGRGVHECPLCGGRRSFCMTCFTDHHEGGWNVCTHDGRGEPILCHRSHPACLAEYHKLACIGAAVVRKQKEEAVAEDV